MDPNDCPMTQLPPDFGDNGERKPIRATAAPVPAAASSHKQTRKHSSMKHASVLAAGLACLFLSCGTTFAADDNAKSGPGPVRIGLYDSRALAYAHFWSPECQRDLQKLMKAAREAQAAGQTNRFNELKSKIKKLDAQNHLQVFSTAPVDDVLAAMKETLAAVQKETGVSRFVSKWDQATLDQLPTAERIEVTDQLLRDFKPNDRQQKVLADMRRQKPLPLEEATKLMREGKL